MVSRLRGSVLGVLWAWVGLVVAGVGFRKMTEYEEFAWAARENALLGGAFDAVVIGAVVAVLAVLIGGMPVAFAAVRCALAEGRKDVPLLLCVPPLCLAIFVGYVLVLMRVVYPGLGRLTVHEPVNVALFLSLAAVFLLAALASAASISAAVTRSRIEEHLFRFALAPAMVAALAMVVVLAGTAVWGLSLRAQAPALFAGDDGLLATSTAATWLAIVAVMGLCACAATVAAVRGLRARSAERSTP